MLRSLAALLGPIFAKEVVEIARRKRYYLSRVLYGLALLFALYLVWQHYRPWQYGSGGASLRELARLAEALCFSVSVIQFGAVFVFVPLFVCGVVAGEREERTLELLFTTRLTDREIILGKLGSRLAALVLLVLFSLPVLSLLTLFGGVDPAALWSATVVTLLATLFAGAHAVYFSAVTRSPLGAAVRTYWWLAVWLVLVPMAVLMPAKNLTPRPTHPVFLGCLTCLHLTNPLFLFTEVVAGDVYYLVATHVGSWVFPCGFIVPTAWSLFLIGRAVRRLRADPVPFQLRLPLVRSIRGRWRRLAERLGSVRRTRPDRSRLFGEIHNPLWLRARRTRAYDRGGYIGRIQGAGWLVALFFLGLAALNGRGLADPGVSVHFGGFAWSGIAALGALLAGAGLVADRRRGFLELVLATPLAGREILDGTLLAVWEHLRRVYWIPWLLSGVFCLTGACRPIGALCSLITGTLFLGVLLLHGVACALTARTVAGALIPTFLFPLLVNLGTIPLIMFFDGAHALLLWPLTADALLVTWQWTLLSAGCAAVGAFLIAAHLALACLGTCWTLGSEDQYPIAAMHPASLTFMTLDRSFERYFRDVPWYAIVLTYWAVLVVNFAWARWWLSRHFDRLAGRAGPPVGRQSRPSEPRPGPLPAEVPVAAGLPALDRFG